MSEEHAEHSVQGYVKVWGVLVVLLVISVIGPELGIQWVTLVTAFGIAVVKAWLVATRFMHIREEPPFVSYAVISSLVLMFLFFFLTAPDVMKDDGTNWMKDEGWQAHSGLHPMDESHGGGHH